MHKTLLLIRTLSFFVFIVGAGIVMMLANTLCLPFSTAQWRYRVFCVSACRLLLCSARVLLGIRIQLKGQQHLSEIPVAIILAKHQSALETFILPTIIPKVSSFVVKRELMFIPIFGWAFASFGMIKIDRKNSLHALRQILKQGSEHLQQGRWVVFFPEGTRKRTQAKTQYKIGGAHLAISTETPVIPIAHNCAQVWPHQHFLKYPGVVTISIGPVIQVNGLDRETLNQKVYDWIETEMLILNRKL